MDRTCLTLGALVLAYLLDLAFGDPPFLPHPVRLIGWIVKFLEAAVFQVSFNSLWLKLAGILIVIVVGGGSTAVVFQSLVIVHRYNSFAGMLFEMYIYYLVLAGGDLRNHLQKVKSALLNGKLEIARQKVALLVGRDTDNLDESGISRAALESLFENSSDGLVAPLLFAALGGPASAVFYKAVSTLDSMIGYKNEKYKDLGFASARLDDLLNLIPARLTAFIILLVGMGYQGIAKSWKVLRADHNNHESPNSAWPEAAAAGVLGVWLGGKVSYEGHLKERPLINKAGRDASAGDITSGLNLFRHLSFSALILCLTLAWLLFRMEVFKF
jgi:adenosylcobinamide-phosphate synthase